jgi:hypothetical protein
LKSYNAEKEQPLRPITEFQWLAFSGLLENHAERGSIILSPCNPPDLPILPWMDFFHISVLLWDL